MLLLGAWSAAIVSVVLAYIVAGDIWMRKHSMFFGDVDKPLRLSGVFGEIFVVTAAAAVLFMIDRVSTQTSAGSVLTANAMVTGIVFTIVFVAVYVHGVMTAMAADPGEKTQLLFTYLVYGVFSTILFGGLCVIAALMVMEALADANAFSAQSDLVLQQLEALKGLPAGEMTSGLNMAYLDVLGVLSGLENAMSPVFVFAAALFGLNLLIRFTPLQAVFVENARYITYATTFTALALVLVTGIWVYTGQYSVFLENVLGALGELRPEFAAADSFDSTRFADVWTRMVDEQALLGFLSRMSDEWGGVAALLGAIQWGAERFSGTDKAAVPAGQTI